MPRLRRRGGDDESDGEEDELSEEDGEESKALSGQEAVREPLEQRGQTVVLGSSLRTCWRRRGRRRRRPAPRRPFGATGNRVASADGFEKANAPCDRDARSFGGWHDVEGSISPGQNFAVISFQKRAQRKLAKMPPALNSDGSSRKQSQAVNKYVYGSSNQIEGTKTIGDATL